MAKPGRPKNLKPNDVKVKAIKSIPKYKARRLYWQLMLLERKMTKDPLSVKPKDYNEALDAYLDSMKELEKLGVTYDKEAKSGVDAGAYAERIAKRGRKTGVGKDGSSDLGARVSTVNPIT